VNQYAASSYFDGVLSAAITGVFTSAALGRRVMVEQFDEDAMHYSVSARPVLHRDAPEFQFSKVVRITAIYKSVS
jgi:hypothetical protein